MYIPAVTYRIQLHKGFNFSRLADLLPYLFELGVTTIYASPVTRAIRGSEHGYDGTNPLEINPEIGTFEQWESITRFLKEHGMGWLQDIVPNHMAYSTQNPWICDVLERGTDSEFYSYFDIIPQTPAGPASEPGTTNPLPSIANRHPLTNPMIPFLEKDLEDCLNADEIKTGFSTTGFYIQYKQQIYPAAISSYNWICSIIPDFFQALLAWSDKTESFALLPWQEWIHFKGILMREVWDDQRLREMAAENCHYINRDPKLLRELLSFQHYELCCWEKSLVKINYRRFFAVNSLICLRMEDAVVFNNWHPLLFSLYDQGLIQGFRIDHIDGLFNPGEYLQKLREMTGRDAYILAEKILEENEEIIPGWPVQGTTGYDFLSFVNQLFIDRPGLQQLQNYFREHIHAASFEDLVFDKKLDFLRSHFGGELDNLMHWLEPILVTDRPPLPPKDIREALAAVMAAFPVYRIYADQLPLSEADQRRIDQAFLKACSKAPLLKKALDWLASLFKTRKEERIAPDLLYFLRRWAQLTAPLAAKGTEDTAFYNYNALISLNEVGDSPVHAAVPVEKFHALMERRQQIAALSLNASSTHDTKRGEDNRLRINLISLFAGEWIGLVEQWKLLNQPFIHIHDGKCSPSANDEYLIYQALVGALPEDNRISLSFRKRFNAYLLKALREEKQETAWENPNVVYEKQCQAFLNHILSPAHAFLASFLPFAKKIISRTQIFSLSQTILKLTAPGIPDIYQGAELWDLSLVDPDNRLPVSFEKRKNILKDILSKEKSGTDCLLEYIRQHASAGAGKIFLIHKLLHFRKSFPDLFNKGLYLPVIGPESFIGYIRAYEGRQLLVLAPLPSSATDEMSVSGIPGISGRWKNILTGKQVELHDSLNFHLLLAEFPVAALVLQND